jgi:heme-degrading monooxygenase HmoA
MADMIARMWRATSENPERYRQVFEDEVLEALRGLNGFRGAYLLTRPESGLTEIRTITLFAALEDVKSFAGEDWRREHVTPSARATLLGSDPIIRHFEVQSAVKAPIHTF